MQITKLIIPVAFALAALIVFSVSEGSEYAKPLQILCLIVFGFGLGVAYSQLWHNMKDKRKTRRPMA